jgi:catechol 2,3-dioxygenase-like lactoylglutathione lyase family enzyme
MPESKSRKFEVKGVNHLAIVCSDKERTIKFYSEILGLPLKRVFELPDGGQQLFFEVSDHSGISFIWYPNPPSAPPGITTAHWLGLDPETGQQRHPPTGRISASAVGSMHHLAFDVPLEKQEEYKERLRAAGIPVTEVNHHIFYGKDGHQVAYPTQLPAEAESIDEFVNSIYFPDPDGILLEFAAWTRPLTPEDVRHVPVSVTAEGEEAEARLVRRERAVTANR